MNWFQKIWKKTKPLTWEYAGCVTATTTLVDTDGNRTHGGMFRGDYLLEERSDGKRRYKLIGYPGSSANANYRLACVEAWIMGANMPEELSLDAKPNGKEKPKDKPKVTGRLIVFPGGKK